MRWNHYRNAEEIFRQLLAQMPQLVSVQSPQIYVLNALGDAAAAHLPMTFAHSAMHLGKDGLDALGQLGDECGYSADPGRAI